MPTLHTRTSPPSLPAHQTDVPSGGQGASAAGTPSSMGYGDSLEAFRNPGFSSSYPTAKRPALSSFELPIHPSIIPLWLYNPKPPHHHSSPKPRRQRTFTRRFTPESEAIMSLPLHPQRIMPRFTSQLHGLLLKEPTTVPSLCSLHFHSK